MKRPGKSGSVWLRPDGRWEGRVVVSGRARTVYGRSSEEAFEKIDLLLADPDSGRETRLTLNRFLDDYWLPSMIDQITGRTMDRYTLDLGYIRPYLGPIRLVELSGKDVLVCYSQMQVAGLSDCQRFQGAKRLRQALKLAVRLEWIRRNPADDFPLPRFRTKEVRPMEPEQVRVFLEANLTCRLYPLYVLALDSGARQGELFALEWADWFPETREVSIHKALEDRRGTLRVKETKTRASRRRVVVSDKTAHCLNKHRKTEGLMFTADFSPYLRCSNFRRDYWQPALRRAGLPNFRFHDLRHTCATLLLLAGDSVNSIADRLGHSSPEMIWRTYGHVLPRMRRESADLMGQYL